MNTALPSRYSSLQKQALQFAICDAVVKRTKFGNPWGARKNLPSVPPATIDSLANQNLIAPRQVERSEFVATPFGIDLAQKLGIPTKRQVKVPDLRARAIILRSLTIPNGTVCGQTDAEAPGIYRGASFLHHAWIEYLGYGTLEAAHSPSFGLRGFVLHLTDKGRKLVEATDTPVTIALGDEEERNLRAGALRQAILEDPRGLSVGSFNWQLCVDHMNSPRDLYKRLYDPAAIVHGTEVRLIRRRDRQLVATARTADWNRIDLWLDPAYGSGYHFDCNFAYSTGEPLNHFNLRVWAPFPEDHEHENVRPGQHERQFARDCGFDSIMSMRDAWRARAQSNGHGGTSRIAGLLIQLADLEVGSS
ncbi:MAG: hypothetical protein FD131_3285 [Rhodocyclaceae bacterium]|nr:MAG: hypothetical protein FD131_3285 [Rhodocyclaceae bacterium]